MNKYTFIGNGRNRDFYFTFPFFSKGDIVVEINNTPATGYGVFCIPSNGNNDFPYTGGHIHFATAPKPTDVVTIERKLQLTRVIDYQPSAGLNATTVNQDMNYFFELLKDIKNDLAGFAQTYADFTDTESAQNLLSRIDAVMDEITNLGDISTIQSSLTNLGTSITNLTNSLNSLSTTVGTHTTDIGTLGNFKDDILDYVIESQKPTSSNGYTWYRKYKSGWIEQGGYVSTANDTFVTITLPIEMSNTAYQVQKTGIGTSTGTTASFRSYCITNRTKTSFQTFAQQMSTQGFMWYLCGIAK